MAENLALNLGGSIARELIGDSIILIDHDTASVTSLTSMLEQFSYKVMSVDVANKALSMIEKHKKDIGLVLANIEMPHINEHSFLDVLHQKDIPLILINPEIKLKEISDLLIKAARFILNKPISENDIKNMWQHVLPKKSLRLKKISIDETQDNQIGAFRDNLKRKRISQTSLLGRRPFIETFKTSKMSAKRRTIANVEWKTKPGCHIEIGNKREEENNIVGKISSVWTYERHMKFLAAISIFGENESRPKSIMKIINDPTLTPRQVASHLQKYKDQVEQISNTLPKSEWKSTDDNTFKYPFDLTKAHAQYSFKKPSAEKKKEELLKFHLGGKLDLSVTNKSFMGTNAAALTLNCEVPVEDLICFDIDFNDMDIHYWLGNNGSFEKSNHPFEPNHLDHDSTFNNRMDSITNITMDHYHFPAMNLGSTSHQHNIEVVNQRESGNNFDYDRDCMDWIEQMLDKDD